MAAESIRVREFLTDLLPFFYGRRLTYVDVGAFEGKIFQEVLASGLEVREAHLIEPNEASLQAARETATKVFKGNSLNFYHLALGASPTKVRMRAARSMTKVTSVGARKPRAGEGESTFEVECTTLDRMLDSFTERHISLLKIDVEGFELEVLEGARAALAGQLVDVVYIEAGMNPEGTQQCYYRKVEDALRAHGYSLFKIYEQQHEWIEDSPLLRRVNLAFMSPAFVARSPYRVSNELFEARKELKELKVRTESAIARMAELEKSVQVTAEKLTGSEKTVAIQKAECDQLKQALARTEQTLQARSSELEQKVSNAHTASTALAQERNALRAQMELLRSSGERLSSKLAAAERQAASLKAEKEQQFEAAERDRRALAERLAAAELRAADLAEESGRQRDALVSAAEAARAMSDERVLLRKDLDDASRRNAELASQREALTNELQRALRQVGDKDAEGKALAQELDQALRQVADLDAQRKGLVHELDQALRHARELDSERKAVVQQLDQALSRISELAAEQKANEQSFQERLAASELHVTELLAERARLNAALTAAADAATLMANERATLGRDLEGARHQLGHLESERSTLEAKLANLDASHIALSRENAVRAAELESYREESRAAENASREVFKLVAQLHRRELKALKEVEVARVDAERVRASAPYQLAESLLALASTRAGRLQASVAFWRELRRLEGIRLPSTNESSSKTPEVAPVLFVTADKPSVALPLTLKPHIVRVSAGAVRGDLCARIVGSTSGTAAEVEVIVAGKPGSDAKPVSTNVRLRVGRSETLTNLLRHGDETELHVRRTAGEFCLLVLEGAPQVASEEQVSAPFQSPPDVVRAAAELTPVPEVVQLASERARKVEVTVRATVEPERSAAIERADSRREFGLSYEAKTKPVPERPAELPADLVLPPLRGVANDYSFIETACQQRWANGKRDYTLPVSIVIPVYNRSREVDFVLAGLLHQTYPRELMEIVIADDGSQEDLSLVYRKYEDRLRIRYCRQDDLGYRLAEVRNLGIATATHDSIVILDSDAIPTEGLIEEYMRRFHVERNIAMFGLRHYVSVKDIDVEAFARDAHVVYNAPRVLSENSVATKAATEGHSTDWREKPIRDTDLLKRESLPYRFLVGANCGFSREVFNKVGGYSDAFRAWGFEDQEFGYRLYREGTYFVPLMDAYVYHQEPLSGKNDTDRKLGSAVTRDIFIQKCPFIYRKKSKQKGPFEVPLVSIYVPLYNRERHIVECVESALAQTVDDLEVVICDDGSTDRSVELVEKHFGGDPRVRLIKQKNAGIGAASNTAVRAARGFYIGQLDADDVLKRDAVEQCLKVMSENPRLSLVYGTTEYIDDNSAFLQEGWNWPRFTREYLVTRMICHHFRFFRKRDWARTTGFNERIRNAVDYDMMLKLAEVGEVVHLNRVLYQYRKHAATTTVQENGLQTQNNYIVLNDSLRRMGITQYTAIADPSRRVERAVKFVPVESSAAISG